MTDTVVHVRIPADLLAAIDAYAAARFEGRRPLALRALIRAGLTSNGTHTPAQDVERMLRTERTCQHENMRGLRCADCGRTAAQIKAER